MNKREKALQEGMKDFQDSMLANVLMKTKTWEKSTILIKNVESAVRKAIEVMEKKEIANQSPQTKSAKILPTGKKREPRGADTVRSPNKTGGTDSTHHTPEGDEILLDVLYQVGGQTNEKDEEIIDNLCISAYEDACEYLNKKALLKKINDRTYKVTKDTNQDKGVPK